MLTPLHVEGGVHMSGRTWALGFVCSFIGIAAGAITGCSSPPKEIAKTSVDSGAGEPESDAGSRVAPSNWDDEDAGNDADSSDDADGGAAEVTVPSCIPSPLDDPDDDFTDTNCDGIDGDKTKAVFVAPTGSDASDGSMEKPVATVTRGIQLAVAKGKDVYLCKGDYSESTIQLASNGVRIYGGYDCAEKWARSSVSVAHLVSTSSSAVTIRNVSDPVVFDRVDITAANGKSGSESSTAVFISNSKKVTLRRGTLQAGSGADGVQPVTPPAENSLPACFAYVYSTGGCYGEPGTDAYQFQNCFYDGQSGAGTITTAPFENLSVFDLAKQSPETQRNTCKSKQYSIGGRGGGTNPSDPRGGTDGTKGVPPSTSGTLNGNDGVSFAPGVAATEGFGILLETGYFASNIGTAGTDGTIGEAGTGGSGGGFTTVFSAGSGDFPYYLYAPRAGGGKGGWGGCGGDGGAAGNPGGASIAVASYRSEVSLERVTLVAASGGKGSAGGTGAKGAAGQPGGACGTAYYKCASCVAGQESQCAQVNKTNTDSAEHGGNGGKGGDGTDGGPGGGGPSIPLVVSGTAPTLSAVTFLPGSGGPGGSNGGPRAADGESSDQKVLP